MSHVDFLFLQSHLYLCRELQQTQVIGNGGTALAHTFGHTLLRHAALLQQMFVGKGYLDGVQVFALDVLHQCQFHHALVLDGADVGRNGRQAGQLAGTPATFTGNDLEAVLIGLAERDGLDKSKLTYAVCQLLQSHRVEFAARLVGIGFNLVQGNLVDGRAALCAH